MEVEKDKKKPSHRSQSKDKNKDIGTTSKNRSNSTELATHKRSGSIKDRTKITASSEKGKENSNVNHRVPSKFEQKVDTKISRRHHDTQKDKSDNTRQTQNVEKLSNSRKNVGKSKNTIVNKISTNKVQSGDRPTEKKVDSPKGDGNYDYEDDFEEYEDDFEGDDEPSRIIDDDIIDEELPLTPRRNEDKADKEEKVTKVFLEPQSENAGSIDTNKAAFHDRPKVTPLKQLETTESKNDTKQWSKSDAKNIAGSKAPGLQSDNDYLRQQSSRINFIAAELTEAQLKFSNRTKRRYNDLSRILELDYAYFDIYDSAPIRDYEYFMLNYGKSNRKQAHQQTHDDNVDRDVQCEEIEKQDNWCQVPSKDLTGTGDRFNENTSTLNDAEILNCRRFRRFIEQSGKLIHRLLTDEIMDESASLPLKSKLPFSDSYAILSLSGLAQKYETKFCIVPKDYSEPLVTVHFVEQSLANDLVDKGIICIWQFSDLTTPEKILLCSSKPNGACLSPAQSELVAGCEDGTLILWDLNEPNSAHKSIPWNDKDLSLRSPSYDTAFLNDEFSMADALTSTPLVGLSVIGHSNVKVTISRSFHYQIVALHQSGVLTLWTVLRGTRAFGRSGENVDLGQRLGATVKLVLISIVNPPKVNTTFSSDLPNGISTNCLCQEPENPTRFYIGTDSGCILKLVKFQSTRKAPSVYQPAFEAPSTVTCLGISPFEPSVMLAGFSDGTISMYKLNLSKPVGFFGLVGPLTSVKNVQWSPLNPFVFYSLHDSSSFSIWDIKTNRSKPIIVYPSPQYQSFYFCNDVVEELAHLAFIKNDETVEVHRLKGQRKKNAADERKKLIAIIERL